MGRIRSIKPEFFTSETIARLSIPAQRTFIGLWTEADDWGVCKNSPRVLAGHLWPFDDEIGHEGVASHLDEMLALGLLVPFVAEGNDWVFIKSWDEHQQISHKSTTRRNPTPPEQGRSAVSGRLPESSGDLPEPSGKLHGGAWSMEQGAGNPDEPSEEDSVAVEICQEVVERWADHSQQHVPKVSPTAVTEVRRLMDRGPTNWSSPRKVPGAEVRAMVDLVFTKGTARSNDGFCWADQIQSGNALRKHWVKLLSFKTRCTNGHAYRQTSTDKSLTSNGQGSYVEAELAEAMERGRQIKEMEQ